LRFLVILIVLVVVVGLALVLLYNNLVRLRNRIEGAWAQIDVQLKRRYDLIPNLVETVKGYASHEKETLDAVVRARNAAGSASGPPTRHRPRAW
jgi:LemA protein